MNIFLITTAAHIKIAVYANFRLQVWMNEVETLMSVEDLGHDLSGVKFLLKKHQGVETDIELHETQLQTLCDQAQALIDGGHFDAGRIEQGTENILQRYLCVSQ